jgi:hypothetical protein
MVNPINRPLQSEDDSQDENKPIKGQKPSGDSPEDSPVFHGQKPLSFPFRPAPEGEKDTGELNEDEARKTGMLSPRRRPSSTDESLPTTAPINQNTSSLGEAREMILLIRGMVERLIIDESIQYILGRFETGARNPGEIDLTPYGAMDRGVSRHHLRIHFHDGRLYVTDLASTNGTFIGKVRLEPNNPIILRKGDELTLGRLPIQILFR